ncbi:MAG: TetR family transcriptional regulator [Phycisphaerae bacterium]|nr:TetR family transcriptional regulator [Phycisphaerae bacterium]
MLVNAPVGSTSSHISWYARLWFQEPTTLKAFQSLLGVRRWFGPQKGTLPSMLVESLLHHEEVTDTLGQQVKRAVEVLVQCLDKADQDRNRGLLHDVKPAELYEAGLTVMMRLVFVLCAEERGLLMSGDLIYDQYYAISTLRGQLTEEAGQHGHEVLERRHDAWARLLAVFRAVYGGIEHETLRMPALGGSLFDPDRFAFLEGRAKGTNWHDTPAQPLPIDNRTVLLLLEALQILEQHGGALFLSYKALDVEQIGHVYEGLLEYTVKRMDKDTLGLLGSQKAKDPNIALAELESARLDGIDTIVKLIAEKTQRSLSALNNALEKEVDKDTFGKLVTACGGDMELAKRIRPYANLLRADAWGDFIVYKANSFGVTLGADRRETGTHYTPKSLTESIVSTTLEPVGYIGPAEGTPRQDWKLKSSAELLNLKVCDPAMGSGAFLVQACRWLSERVVEAWGNEEKQGKFITVDGEVLDDLGGAEPMPKSLDDRLIIARRLVAVRCLYGVDINPLAVELAKLSIWLVTLAKGRPFGFLDHNLRCGDSLLGIHRLDQLTKLTMNPDDPIIQPRLFGNNIEQAVTEAMEIRKKLRQIPIRDIHDVETMAKLDDQARKKLEGIELVADAMIGEVLCSSGNAGNIDTALNTLAGLAQEFLNENEDIDKAFLKQAQQTLSVELTTGKPMRMPLHWPLEFPEVFERGGFDGVIGNPPFLGNKKITGILGHTYRDYLVKNLAKGKTGLADLCAYFFLRTYILIKDHCNFGLIATDTIAQGDTRLVGLDSICNWGGHIYQSIPNIYWPGTASVVISLIWIHKNKWSGAYLLSDKQVQGINTLLSETGEIVGNPYTLERSKEKAFIGSLVLGTGFILSRDEALNLINRNSKNKDVLLPYIGGQDLNSSPKQSSDNYVIYFADWPLDRDTAPPKYVGPVASDYPDCLSIVEHRVKPERDRKKRKAYKERWWRFAELQTAAYKAIASKGTVLLKARVSPIHALVFVPNGQIYNEKTVIFSGDFDTFSIFQSSFHEIWAVHYSPTMGKTTLSYSPTACVETFPLPTNYDGLAKIGRIYHNQRTIIMDERKEGLTKIFNRFNSPEDLSGDILKIRNLHVEMDNAVAVVYGWDDIGLGHGFHDTKQGLRFTISEEARREVLQRLLKLNHERYAEEVAQGLHDKKARKTKSAKTNSNEMFDFIDDSSEESK